MLRDRPNCLKSGCWHASSYGIWRAAVVAVVQCCSRMFQRCCQQVQVVAHSLYLSQSKAAIWFDNGFTVFGIYENPQQYTTARKASGLQVARVHQPMPTSPLYLHVRTAEDVTDRR